MFQVLFTIDFKDIFCPYGMEQVGTIVEAIIEEYYNGVTDPVVDALLFKENWIGIRSLVSYKLEQVSPPLPYSVDEAIDLILGQIIDYFYDTVPNFCLSE